MSALPLGWGLADIAQLIALDGLFSDGDWIESRDQDPNGTIRLLQLADIGDGFFIDKSNRFINEEQFDRLRCTEVFEGDVLIARMPDPLGRVCITPAMKQRCITVVDVAIVRPGQSSVNPNWLMHFLNAPPIRQEIELQSSGTTRRRITRGKLAQMKLPIPPLNEQKRIADKLDALLARVDACRQRLDRIPAILKRFRQAVLAAATSGKLTEKWQNTNSHRVKWESVKFTDVGELSRGKSKHRPRNDSRLYGGPYPFIQTGDIAQSGGRITTHSQTYSELGLAQSKLWPSGTVCITIAANIADTAILTYPACFPDSIVGFISNSEKCLPEFIKWSIDVMSEQIESFAPATAQKNINLAILNDLEFPCPSIDEQREIVRRVEALFAYADRLEARYTAARAQVERLTPVLLAKAFRGELVPQDPNDEPASVLLERIRLTRAENAAKSQRTRRKAHAQNAVFASGSPSGQVGVPGESL